MKVAITGVGGGVGQAVIRSLRLSQLPLHLFGLDACAWSAGLYQCDAACIIPKVADGAAYRSALINVVATRQVEALIPGTDTELHALALARNGLEALGCTTVVSSPAVVQMARDKMATYQMLSRAGVPFARTAPAREFARTSTAGSFPAILKPRDGSGSVGARVLFTAGDLESLPLGDGDIIQEYLVPAAWNVSHLRPEDLVRGGRMRQDDELSVQGMVAPDGTVVGVFVSVNELRDGVVMRVEPTLDAGLTSLAWDVLEILARLGHVGPCNVEGRITRHGPVFYEINPRFTGVTAARAAMGFNECDAALRLFVRKEAPASVAAGLACRTDLVCIRYVDEQIVPRSVVEEVDGGSWSAPTEAPRRGGDDG